MTKVGVILTEEEYFWAKKVKTQIQIVNTGDTQEDGDLTRRVENGKVGV